MGKTTSDIAILRLVTSNMQKQGCENLFLIDGNTADVQAIHDAMRAVRFNASLTVARTGRDALAMLHRIGKGDGVPMPSLILIDLQLPIPGPDGRDVLAEIKNVPALRLIPILILTASDEGGDVRLSYQLGANAFIRKPDDPEDYRTLIDRIRAFWCDGSLARPRADQHTLKRGM